MDRLFAWKEKYELSITKTKNHLGHKQISCVAARLENGLHTGTIGHNDNNPSSRRVFSCRVHSNVLVLTVTSLSLRYI